MAGRRAGPKVMKVLRVGELAMSPTAVALGRVDSAWWDWRAGLLVTPPMDVRAGELVD